LKAESSFDESGGRVIFGPAPMDKNGRFYVIEDPVGAVTALFEQK
jgi:predicted enzyme related to lactoylglutathione lyase